MEKREKVVSLNTIGTALSIIAAVVSAFFAFRANDLMERQTALMESQSKPDIILDEGSYARIEAGRPCYNVGTASVGLGSVDVGYNLAFTMNAVLYVDNVGGKPISVLGRMTAKDKEPPPSGIEHYFFINDIAQKGITETMPILFPLAIPFGETRALQLNGSTSVFLGADLAEAQPNYELERNWKPELITLMMNLGGGIGAQELTLPVYDFANRAVYIGFRCQVRDLVW